MTYSLLVKAAPFVLALSGCAFTGDRPTTAGTYWYFPKEWRAATGSKNPLYFELPHCPNGCVVRAYSWPIPDPKVAQVIDWADYLRSEYGMIFPKGGFASYLPKERLLIIANTPEVLDSLMNPM